jgi:hypothetical protein
MYDAIQKFEFQNSTMTRDRNHERRCRRLEMPRVGKRATKGVGLLCLELLANSSICWGGRGRVLISSPMKCLRSAEGGAASEQASKHTHFPIDTKTTSQLVERTSKLTKKKAAGY